MSPELKQKLVEFYEKDRIIPGNKKEKKSNGEKILEYSLRIPFSLFNARLFSQGGLRHQIISLFFLWW